MSFIIKGFDTDGNCLHCYFQSEDSDRCILTDDDIPLYGKGHPNSCPLIPLPGRHGRLGDLDALEAKFREEALEHTLVGDLNRMTLGVGEVIDRIRMADTIVPAEGGTDECSEN